MPKQKTKSAVTKRFKISKNGKAMCSHPARGHQLAVFNGSVKRNLRKRMVLNSTWSRLIRDMMGA